MGEDPSARGLRRSDRRRRLRRRQLRRLTLSRAQQAALEHVRAVARRDEPAALERLAARGVADADEAATVAARPIACNFHPDRRAADGRLVVDALRDDGNYRSQFETRISNGGLSAFPGGDRDRWEEALFGGAYQRPEVTAAERPRYGGLDLHGHPDGPCPRFGSCVLELAPHVSERATFTFGDSHAGPTDVGTADAFLSVLAAIAEHDRPWSRLDEYVEVQVHGPIDLAHDAVALTVDPSFHGTAVGDALAATAERYGLELRTHHGFELHADEVPSDFRGPAIPVLAQQIAARTGDPVLHAARLGEVGPDVDLQHVKQLWHVLVAFGRPGLPRLR